MHGPTVARISARAAPSSSMASITASPTPDKAPRHPACATPITFALGSDSKIGAQSAVSTPSAMPGNRPAPCASLISTSSTPAPSMPSMVLRRACREARRSGGTVREISSFHAGAATPANNPDRSGAEMASVIARNG